MNHVGSRDDDLHDSLSDDHLEMLDLLLAEEGVTAAAPRAIERSTSDAPAPLSFAQELLWQLDHASPGLTAYNAPLTRRVRGPLDVDALRRATREVAQRHESLRTAYP